MRLLTTLSLLLLVAPFSWAQVTTYSDLNKKIKDAGGTWTAGPTSVSHLSKRETKAMLDQTLDPNPEVRFETPENALRVMATNPSSIDWRNKNGRNWMSAIRNQNQCGSCLAFAATATMETQYRITKNSSSYSIKLSPQFIFSCGGGKCAKGWYPDQAAQFLKSTGATDEACMPYSSSSGADVACKRACSNASSRTLKISSYSTPTSGTRSLDAIRTALQRGPLVTTMSVYNDFMNYRRGIYKHVYGSYAGGHAITLIGYNDTDRYLIIRNSWGTTWGEAGYGRISYDDISGIGSLTYKYEIPVSKVFAIEALNETLQTRTEQAENTVVSAEPDFALTSSDIEASSHSFELTLANRTGDFVGPVEFHQVSGAVHKKVKVTMNGSQLKIRLNTDLFAAGDWEFYVTAKNSRGQVVKSDSQRMTIEP